MTYTFHSPDGDNSPQTIAMEILNDLLSDSPTYDYDLSQTGEYARQLAILVKARKNSLQAAQLVLNAIKARPDSELATLLREYKKANHVEFESDSLPPLPQQTRLPEGFLPRHGDTSQEWEKNLRQISPFLAEYILYSQKRSPEGYTDFHIASAVWLLSTVAGRRIYVDLENPVYTPLTLALVARTSLFAKSTTAAVAVDVLKTAGLSWLLGDDETTPQKLLSDMSGRVPSNYNEMEEERKEKIRQRIAMSGQVGWYYDEFNQLIDAMMRPGPMAEFAGLLRKLDNCPDEYKYSTRAHGQEIIYKPYLALLASTTPANLRKHAGKNGDFWNDGFWARFAFITPPPDQFETKTVKKGHTPMPPRLKITLQEWGKRLGIPDCTIEEILSENGKGTGRYKAVGADLPETQIDIDETAYLAYVTYREALRQMIATNTNGSNDLDGSYSRLSDKAIRIAALVASLENRSIDLPIWTLAQEISELFRRNLHEFYAQVNAGIADNSLEDAIIEFLKSRNGEPVTARDVIQWGPREIRKLKTAGVRELFINLERSGIIQCTRQGKKESYSLCK